LREACLSSNSRRLLLRKFVEFRQTFVRPVTHYLVSGRSLECLGPV
jgi:hypothetical protein